MRDRVHRSRWCTTDFNICKAKTCSNCHFRLHFPRCHLEINTSMYLGDFGCTCPTRTRVLGKLTRAHRLLHTINSSSTLCSQAAVIHTKHTSCPTPSNSEDDHRRPKLRLFSTPVIMSFLGGAECSTAGNPLSQFTKHVQDDKSLQRDRLVGRGPGGMQEGMRSQQMGGGSDGVSRSVSWIVACTTGHVQIMSMGEG